MRFITFLFFFSFILSTELSEAICVKESMANLRSGPGSEHAISWVVGRYTPFVFQSRKGPWYKVKDQDGEMHWVHKKLVTSGFKCLSIRTRFANLRTGAGTQFPQDKYRVATKYEPFKKIKREGDWYFVKNNYGKTFWIHKGNVWIPRKNISIHF